MRKIPRILLAVSTILIFGSLSWAAGETQQTSQAQYSADSYMETSKVTLKSKVYVVPGKERKEQEMGGMTQVTIMRLDKGVMWMVMPEQKMYMEMSMKNGKQKDPDASQYKIEERTEMGKETIDGREATKYKTIMTGPEGKKFGGFVWVVDPGIQIKMDAISKDGDSKERIKMELSNLKVENQDPSLFEVPAGYSQMTMPNIPGMGIPGFGQ